MIRSIGVKNLSKSSIAKINRMIKAVLAEPYFFDQNTFYGAPIGEDNFIDLKPCQTTSCGAGWAIWNKSRALYAKLIQERSLFANANWAGEALKALDLEVSENYNTSVLFGEAGDWPSPFDYEYADARTDKERAKVFARRWKFFIETDGTDEK